MSDEPKKCPYRSCYQGCIYCDESECMAWREVETGRWDCALIVKRR